MTQKKVIKEKAKDFAAGALLTAGLLTMMVSAGNSDERDARIAQNIYMGEEVYDPDEGLLSRDEVALTAFLGMGMMVAGGLRWVDKSRER